MDPFLFQIFLECLNSNEFDDDLLISIILHRINQKSPVIYKVPKSSHWYDTILFNYDDTRYRKTLRMKQSTFWEIVNKIRDHNIFQRERTPIEKQLAVVLYRLGGKSTVWEICTKFGIAEATVLLFTSRIITALRSLKSQAIIWP